MVISWQIWNYQKCAEIIVLKEPFSLNIFLFSFKIGSKKNYEDLMDSYEKLGNEYKDLKEQVNKRYY